MGTEDWLFEIFKIRKKDRAKIRFRQEKKPEKLSVLLDALFQRTPLGAQKLMEGQAIAAWKKIVGEKIAAVAEAKKVQERRLYVQVPSPLWRQELIFAKSQILAKYRENFPSLELRDIYFVG